MSQLKQHTRCKRRHNVVFVGVFGNVNGLFERLTEFSRKRAYAAVKGECELLRRARGYRHGVFGAYSAGYELYTARYIPRESLSVYDNSKRRLLPLVGRHPCRPLGQRRERPARADLDLGAFSDYHRREIAIDICAAARLYRRLSAKKFVGAAFPDDQQ